MTPAERFWMKVDKDGPGGCWVWRAGTFKARMGYGKFQAGTSRATAQPVYAHRYSWELAHGPVPEGMWVLHRCDNPPCVRPDHLFLGDDATNKADMMSKGRQKGRGATRPVVERAPRHAVSAGVKLSPTAVRVIRQRRDAGEMFKDIARDFGISTPTAHNAYSGARWGSVDDRPSDREGSKP